MAKASWTYRDESDEISTVELTVADVSAGGADFDAIMAEVAGLGAAILGVTTCVQAREFFNQAVDVKDPATPADPQAARESALRVFYGDDVTGEVYHVSIPGPDWDAITMEPNTDLADMTETPVSTLVSQIESDSLSPVGNAVSVLRCVKVGRHN